MTETDKLANAKQSGQACFDNIREMVEALQEARRAHEYSPEASAEAEGAVEDAERAIHEDALSVEVRSGWYGPGAGEVQKPCEYRILLCTGGPAVQIVGDLSEHGEPITAVMQVQDWLLPWTDFYPVIMDGPHSRENAEATMLAYACCFYFGE